MKYNKSVYRNLALITQVGISMMAPILLCVLLGVYLDNKFHTYFVIPLLILGILAGYRNVYLLIRNADKKDHKEEKK
jgi:ATP synthase protein I